MTMVIVLLLFIYLFIYLFAFNAYGSVISDFLLFKLVCCA